MRAAIRALPVLVYGSKDWKNCNLLPLLRISAMNWASCKYGLDIFHKALEWAARHDAEKKGQNRMLVNVSTGILFSGRLNHNRSRESENFAFSITNSIASLDKHFNEYNSAAMWNEIELDCDQLLSVNNGARYLCTQPLWHNAPPRSWIRLRTNFHNSLNREGRLPSVWSEWFDRRVQGDETAFDIGADQSAIEDERILIRLAEATDDEFWKKNYAFIDITLRGWLDEVRNQVAPAPQDFASHVTALPQQNPGSISFITDDLGKIAINATAVLDELRKNPAARDRHAEAVREASEWLEKCRTNNAASRLAKLLGNYLEAAGDNLEAMKPSLFVQRGERLRQELARYDVFDNMLPPVADELLLDGKGWQSAHNMAVGLDPVLNASDTAMLGPDRRPILIAPSEIREKAREAEDLEMLANGVIDIIEEAADLAPATPDPSDRRTIWSTEMVRNLLIETFALALNHPYVASSTMVAGAILTSAPVAGVIGGFSVLSSLRARAKSS